VNEKEVGMGVVRIRALAVAFVLLGAVLLACGVPAGPQIQVENIYARPAAGMGESATGGVFMVLRNTGSEADRLVAVRCSVAGTAEIHETTMEGDVMKMRPVAGGIEVPAGGQVELKPGGYHVMLIGLKQDLQEGDRFPVELQFEKSGPVTVEVQVRMP
jgi:copper(I)-binding protein